MFRLGFGGPALATGALWTMATRAAAFGEAPSCVRCGAEAEDTMHRLWDCPENAVFRHALDEAVPGNHFPNRLPPCMTRCGIAPKDLMKKHNLCATQVIAIQRYLLDVNAAATLAIADPTRHTRPSEHIRAENLYASELPPCRRRKARPPADSSHEARVERSRLPAPLRADIFSHEVDGVVSVDGSFDNGRAGWGFTVALPGARTTLDFAGPVALSTHYGFIGAEIHSNNTGELSGLFFALRWVATQFRGPRIIIEFDSTYAAGIACKRIKLSRNLALAMAVRIAHELVCVPIVWRKAAAHTGSILNGHADSLAKYGAAGNVLGDAFDWKIPLCTEDREA